MTPLINVIPVPWNHAPDSPKKTVKAHLDNIIAYIKKSWPGDYPLFLDLMYVASSNEAIEDRHAAIYFFEILCQYGQKIIPVTGLDRDDNYQNAIKSIIRRHKLGICFRIQQDELDDLDELADALDSLLRTFNVETTSCDVILDFQALPLQDVRDPIPKIPEMKADTTMLIPREEFTIWQNVIINGDIARLPSFGDYSIQHPAIEDVDFRKRKIPVSLRYATTTHWLVYKGREKNRFGHNQFNEICSALVRRHEYSGSNFSEGDNYINSCARNTAGPGRPEEWRRVGFNHHMTLVATQLANLDGP